MEPCVEVLKAADGHLTIQVGKDPAEHAQAKKVVEDMLKRGYALFVELEDGTTRRVKSFNAADEEYIVMDVPENEETPAPDDGPKVTLKKTQAGRKKSKQVPMRKARATGLAPTAGG